MPICGSQNCGCAFTSESLSVSGNGTPENPWVIETIDPVSLVELEDDIEAIEAVLAALPGTYVNITGDTMTGPLNVLSVSGASLQLRRGDAEAPYVEFRSTDNSTRLGFIQVLESSGMVLASEVSGTPIRLYGNGVERARLLANGYFLVGKTALTTNVQGCELHPAGTIVATRTDSASTPCFIANKDGTGEGSGASFLQCRVGNVTIGSVTRNGATNAVLYNTTSDGDQKTVIGDLDPELAEYVARLVTPVLHTWNDDPESLQMAGYIAQQVATVWPGAIDCGLVTPGQGDIANRHWDQHGVEQTTPEEWTGWQMDRTMLIPILHAAWQNSANKLDALTARVDALEAAVG